MKWNQYLHLIVYRILRALFKNCELHTHNRFCIYYIVWSRYSLRTGIMMILWSQLDLLILTCGSFWRNLWLLILHIYKHNVHEFRIYGLRHKSGTSMSPHLEHILSLYPSTQKVVCHIVASFLGLFSNHSFQLCHDCYNKSHGP